jgi:transposase
MANGGHMPDVKMFVGFDLGNDRHALCLVDEGGRILLERTVANDHGVLDVLRELLHKHGVNTQEVYVAVEDMHCPLVDALVAQGFAVFTINPKQVDRFRDRVAVSGAKDDRRDARVLAQTLRTDGPLYRRIDVGDESTTALRVLEAAVDRMDDDFRRSANQLRALVLRCWPTFLALCPGADEAWFWGFLELVIAEKANDDALAKLLKTHRKRKVTVAQLRVIVDAPRFELIPGMLQATAKDVLRQSARLALLLTQRSAAQTQRTQILASLKGTAQQPSDIDIISSAPGCGPVTTSIIATTLLHALKADGGLGLARALAGVAPVTKALERPSWSPCAGPVARASDRHSTMLQQPQRFGTHHFKSTMPNSAAWAIPTAVHCETSGTGCSACSPPC